MKEAAKRRCIQWNRSFPCPICHVVRIRYTRWKIFTEKVEEATIWEQGSRSLPMLQSRLSSFWRFPSFSSIHYRYKVTLNNKLNLPFYSHGDWPWHESMFLLSSTCRAWLLPKFPRVLITIDREYGSRSLIDVCPSNFSYNRI